MGRFINKKLLLGVISYQWLFQKAVDLYQRYYKYKIHTLKAHIISLINKTVYDYDAYNLIHKSKCTLYLLEYIITAM